MKLTKQAMRWRNRFICSVIEREHNPSPAVQHMYETSLNMLKGADLSDQQIDALEQQARLQKASRVVIHVDANGEFVDYQPSEDPLVNNTLARMSQTSGYGYQDIIDTLETLHGYEVIASTIDDHTIILVKAVPV